MAAPSRFCVRWIRKTIRNVTIVVPVLITSCHVSEKPKRGPVTIQTTMTVTARANAIELPDASVAACAKRSRRGALRVVAERRRCRLVEAASVAASSIGADAEARARRRRIGVAMIPFEQATFRHAEPVGSGLFDVET